MRTRLSALYVVVAGLVVALVASAGVAAATTTTKHHHHHGKITAISGDSITIEAHHKKNGEKITTSKTFKLDGNTTVSFKTKSATTAAATSDLKVGQHVQIEDASGTAKTIAIHQKHGKKNGAKAAAADAAAAVSAANAAAAEKHSVGFDSAKHDRAECVEIAPGSGSRTLHWLQATAKIRRYFSFWIESSSARSGRDL